MTQRILLVDDEPNVLQGFKRHLRKKYDLHTAVGGPAAIEVFQQQGPFAVVVSDMQMPIMSGVELLQRLRELDDRTVRMMLTGNADQKTAVDAVNEGCIFRFLNKPCPPEELAKSLDAALEQYRLVTAETELLSKTLAGSVRVLTQVLSLAMPEAFGMTQEARALVRSVAEKLEGPPSWQLEIAAMLMHIGCVSLPPEIRTRHLAAEDLSPEEAVLVRDTPRLGHDLVAEIPRLLPVAQLILHLNDPPQGDTPLGSRILRSVGDYQRLRQNRSNTEVLQRLEESSKHDPQVVKTLAAVLSENCVSREVTVSELREGMVLEAHVEDSSGMILLAAGNEVHEAMIQKLTVLRRSGRGVREPILVRVMQSLAPEGDQEPSGDVSSASAPNPTALAH